MIWLQQWTDVLFLHFPVAERHLRSLIPDQLTLDTHGESAWISYVFFHLGLRPTWLPNVPGFSSLLELNVRTYVRFRDQAGIYFLRMYADNRLAIMASRALTPFRYELASIDYDHGDDGSRNIACRPRKGVGSTQLRFQVNSALAETAPADSRDAWLLERYRAFVVRSDHSLLTATVEHPPWKTSPVELFSYEDGLMSELGILPSQLPALMHHSAGLAARFNAFGPANNAEIVDATVHDEEKVAGAGFEPTTSRL